MIQRSRADHETIPLPSPHNPRVGASSHPLRVVIIKPSKYLLDGTVERFRRGFMPNSTVPFLRSMVPHEVQDTPVEVHSIDEYVRTDVGYLNLLHNPPGHRTLLALVGVQSHQFHRALDLAAYARQHGCMAVLGGPHVMTCDTSMLHGMGISFALAEAELIWPEILRDAANGELKPVYGMGARWQENLDSPVITPPSRDDLGRYVVPMLGVYPARGCPFLCNFCSVTKIAGRRIRSQSIDKTLESLRNAKAAGVHTIMFTSDNFNKYPQAAELLDAMIEEKLNMKFFVQCDTQIARQENMVERLARAGCYQMFVGVESFDRQTLQAAQKKQNRPDTYHEIVQLCREYGIGSHFSNIIGFPRDTEAAIHEHLAALQEMAPSWASFYILCPIPGTEQYDDFLAEGLITERNLDRFDTTCLTWRHPDLSPDRLSELLFECYRKFFSASHAAHHLRHSSLHNRHGSIADSLAGSMAGLAMTLFVRFCAWQRTHPMSGGIGRVRLDRVDDYLPLRKQRYGFELAPLPRSLQLVIANDATLREDTNHAATRAMSNPRESILPFPSSHPIV
jgi:hypothetical protein